MTDTPTPRDLVESGSIGGTRVDDGGRPVVDDGGRPLTYDSPSASDVESGNVDDQVDDEPTYVLSVNLNLDDVGDDDQVEQDNDQL